LSINTVKNKNMKQLLTLPTWVLVRILIPILPKKHIWKNRKFTLKYWAEHSTQLNDSFSMFFWVNAIALLFFIVFILC